jgi:amino acid permease
MQMFSIINELEDDSPSSLVRVIGSSIGSAATIYIVVAITGYITFGNDVVGNIISMCKPYPTVWLPLLARQPLSFLFSSPSRCKFIPVAHRSTLP